MHRCEQPDPRREEPPPGLEDDERGATATRSCAVPTDHQWKPPIQKIGIRNQP